ncbi:MAG TPA: ACT domain-containing protein, partial [Ktedonobacteraceae bacterium]
MLIRQPDVTLLVSCPDQPGIVASISRFIFEHGGNILESDQHSTNQQECQFFMRVSFAEEGFRLAPADLVAAFEPIAKHLQMRWSVSYARTRKRVGILVSKLDHCLTDLLWRWKSGELAMDLAFVLSNHPDLEPLAQMYGIPYHFLPLRRESRQEDQRRMLDLIGAYSVDFLILARYMQILEAFV